MALTYKTAAQLGIPLVLSLLLLAWGAAKVLDPVLFPLRVVSMTGDFHYLAVEPAQRSILEQFQQGFFHVDLRAVQQWVEAMPWVQAATVRRVWPDTLQVQVWERQPFAKWQDTQLLNAQGRIFAPTPLPDGLPELSGPEATERLVLDQYRQMGEILATINLTIEQVRLDERRDWQVTLDNGIVLQLGHEQMTQRLERVVKTFQKILVRQPERQIKTIDLRYPNGFAIRWEQDPDKEGIWPRKI